MSKLCFFLLFVWPSLTVSVYDGSATDNKENNREDLSPVNVHGYDASSTAHIPPVVIDPRRRPRERGEGRSAAGLPGMVISDGMARRNLRRNGRSSGMVISDGYSRMSGPALDRDPTPAQTSTQPRPESPDGDIPAWMIQDFRAKLQDMWYRPEGKCPSIAFQCRNMKCIPKRRRGDGADDCGDNSDEQTGECPSDYFQCWNMICIHKTMVGDGGDDCGDNSDEQTGECRSDYFQCRNMKCIHKNRVGDGANDCGDNGDEQTGECPSDYFQCWNMKCIHKNRVGDGGDDCGDNSDEQTGECRSDYFQCRNMNCIHKNRVGDGYNDCGDNSDEETGECRSDYFQCRNMKCIYQFRVGNGNNDCGDNSDEQTGECRSGYFQCRNMKCIPGNRVGNGYNDCGDNSDEETDRGRSFDGAVGGSSEHTSSNTGDNSSNDRNRPTTENTGDSSAIIRVTTENTEDNSARIGATTENITARRRSRFGWYSAVTGKRRLGRIPENIRQTGDDVGSAATLGVTTTYNRAPAPNPSVPLSCPEPNGLFPHPYECSKYLQCDRNSLFTRTCGPGTVFNPLNSLCDWPYNVNCQAVATPPVVATTPPVVVTPPPRRATTWHGFDLRLNLEG